VTSFSGREPNKTVKPDEVVAIGAAIQAGVLKCEGQGRALCSTSPAVPSASQTKGGVMTKLIERNTTIPTKRTEVFTTAEDMPAVGGDPRAAG